MTTENETNEYESFHVADITNDQAYTLLQKCNDEWARATLRKLRSFILFAQDEPTTIPIYDEAFPGRNCQVACYSLRSRSPKPVSAHPGYAR